MTSQVLGPTFLNIQTKIMFHRLSANSTWKIILVSKWLITIGPWLVFVPEGSGCGTPKPNGLFFWLINGGLILTTEPSPGMALHLRMVSFATHQSPIVEKSVLLGMCFVCQGKKNGY